MANHKHGSWTSRLFKLIVVFGVVIAIGVGLLHARDIQDWWKLRDYHPPAAISNLADETTMTAKARRYFYVTHPSIEDRQAFNQNCKVDHEQTIVLGCYVSSSQSIYIFNVDDNRLNGVEEVTAAHEMLHAAYARLGQDQKTKLDAMLEQQMKLLSGDSHLQDLIAIYNKQEPGQLLNEMHSILGTEYGHLEPNLEAYYSQYFTNRQAVVDYANSYKSVFNQMQTQITQDEQLLRDLKQSISQAETSIAQQRSQLDTEITRLNSLRQTNPEAYNAAIPAYNTQVDQYNLAVSRYKNLIDQYNNLVKSHNNIAIDYNNLSHELDSNYQPIAQ